jgi:hypothetical protein
MRDEGWIQENLMSQPAMRFQPWIKMPNSRSSLFVLILLGIFLTACTPDENESFIQGTWFYNDMHIQQTVGESFSQSYWYFDRGTYETTTCCFVEFQQYGRYNILESGGDRLILDLFNIDGKFNSEHVQIMIRIDRQADTISMARAGPFTRVVP